MADLLISIILPTHNRLALLREAIESVREQAYTNWELIVIDDGSTDGTKEFLEGLLDDRIRTFHQTNQQASAARNRGMQEISGRYFCFLDDDDLLDPQHLAQLAEELEVTDQPSPVYRVGQVARTPKGEMRTNLWNNIDDALPQFWAQPTGAFCYFFATEPIRHIEWNNHRLLLEDFTWMNEVLRHHGCYQLPKYTAIVRQHEDQRSGNYLNDELLQQNIATLAECYNLKGVSERVDFDLYRKQVLHQYLHYARQLSRKGKRMKAMGTLKKASSYATPEEWKEMGTSFAKILLG
ncbi:glycosyltransferase family 2 protein [Lewinella sp. 4G2]|uniref:glycosyltransferase family 2 protein n=1 Tax=Lewinella sp. 4G2 TaxID=1803372 RepID=UPI0007B46802|nr:glycosyltransferase family 2 protein [Lewinella sp. 4G2]OAV44885.1 hypothetical protein A3850_010450 [Lewinella sp. 4G2]